MLAAGQPRADEDALRTAQEFNQQLRLRLAVAKKKLELPSAGDLGLFRTIKYGVEGTGMAPWDDRLSDREIWQVVNYVKSIQL